MPRSNPFDYFFILRPLILIPSWNFLLIGSYLAVRQGRFTLDIIAGLFIYTFVMGGVYILNQIMDIETDRLNKKLFLLTDGYVTTRAASIEIALLWTSAAILSIRFGWLFVILVLVSILLGAMYSVPPLKLKGKPIIDTLANGIGYGIVNFSIGWLLVREFDPSMLGRFVPYLLSICAVFINTTIVDVEGDRKAGDVTTGVFLGVTVSYIVSALAMVGAVIVAFSMHDYICLIPAAVSLPLFVYVAAQKLVKNRVSRKATIASFRLPGLVFTVITGVLYPPYFLLLFALLFGMRVYYRRRFGMAYPTLSGG